MTFPETQTAAPGTSWPGLACRSPSHLRPFAHTGLAPSLWAAWHGVITHQCPHLSHSLEKLFLTLASGSPGMRPPQWPCLGHHLGVYCLSTWLLPQPASSDRAGRLSTLSTVAGACRRGSINTCSATVGDRGAGHTPRGTAGWQVRVIRGS